MAQRSLTSRITPPILAIALVGCAWYAAAHHNENVTVATPKLSTETKHPKVQADVQPLPATAPLVQKMAGMVNLSVNTTPYKHVQKVEYYVENHLVGAAFTAPYSVSIDENGLTAGAHTVVAKVYTSDQTSQTPPTQFSAAPQSPTVATQASDSDTSAPVTTSPPPTPPTATSVQAPNDVSATAGDDATSANVSWSAVTDAVSYQVWRDGVQINTTSSPSYIDNGLTGGQTYDYQVVSVAADGSTSGPSNTAAVTMPTSLASTDTPVNQPAFAPNATTGSPSSDSSAQQSEQ